MIKPEIPENEEQRVKALLDYEILDTLPEQDFDDLTKIAAEICNTPISLVSLIDPERQWFKSHFGLDATETPRDLAFCAHAINEPDELLVVPDASKDERFFDNPLSTDDPNVIFYAGAPLVTSEGLAMGTLCVIDHEAKQLTKNQEEALQALARQVVGQMEHRKNRMIVEKTNRELTKSSEELQAINKELDQFAYIVSHDLKAPLRGISTLATFIMEDYSDKLDEDGREQLKLMLSRVDRMNNLINGILQFSRIGRLKQEKEQVDLEHMLTQIKDLIVNEEQFDFRVLNKLPTIQIERVLIEQIFQNLISNAVKYNDKPKGLIEIGYEQVNGSWKFSVTDNGPGIEEKDFEKIFQIFQTLQAKDTYESTGIGLSLIKKTIDNWGGEIWVESTIGKGSSFILTIPQKIK